MDEMDLSNLPCTFFSVIVNSAGCERVFSSFRITHTKLRLSPEKVHKSAVVGMEIKRVLEENNLARNRKKRKFGEDKSDNASSPSNLTDNVADSDATDLDFREYAEITFD